MSLAVAYGIQAGASILGGLFGKRAASKQARAARAMAQYNANVARMNAQSEAAAIEQQTKKLGKQQRELKAQQILAQWEETRRRSVNRGGGGDNVVLQETTHNTVRSDIQQNVDFNYMGDGLFDGAR